MVFFLFDFLEWFESFFQLLVAERQIELVVRDLLLRDKILLKYLTPYSINARTPRIENTTPLFVSNSVTFCFNRSEDMKK